MTAQPEPTHRVPRVPGSTADCAPAEESARSLSRSTYEVRIRGPLPPSLLLGLHDVVVATTPSETVLHRPAADQDALGDLLDELHALGLTIFELHRLPGPFPSLGRP